MKKLFRKAVAVAAVSAMLLHSFSAVALAETVEISGNGSESDNIVSVETVKETVVVQSNEADIDNDIEVEVETGENEVNDNTGGDALVMTGNASGSVDVSTRVNLNAVSDEREVVRDDTSVLISGNGADSDNDVDLESFELVEIFQDNYADIDNDVEVDAETGENEANRNTGGETVVVTGHADAEVTIENTANANLVNLEGPANGVRRPSYDVRVVGNGAYSDTEVDVFRSDILTIVQDNYADIDNDVEVDAETGENEANDNTGGDVMVDTGMAETDVEIDNLANLNVVSTDGWMPEFVAKVGMNGYQSDNFICALFEDELAVFQGDERGSGNYFDLENDLDTEPETGKSEANRNTADAGDPLVITGHADAYTRVRNIGNANFFGSRPSLTLPGNIQLSFSFDLDGLMGNWF